MPSSNVELADGKTILKECNSGWFWLAPASLIKTYPLISEVVENQYAVIAFGDVFKEGSNTGAQIILNAWKSGGAKKVRALEGCFSAVIVDRRNGATILIGDPLGQRNLRYYTNGETLIASPHEVSLVATGYCPIEFDYISACSIVSVTWSLRGKSLLKKVHTCHASEYVKWLNGKLQVISDSVFDSSQRIEKGDSTAISKNLDQMLEVAQLNIRNIINNQSEVETTLSAGLDTRGIFSLLLSIMEPSQIIAYSSGDPDYSDVKVASKIAKIYGTRFYRKLHSPAVIDTFISHSDLIAYSMNGDCPGSFGLFPLPELEPYAKLIFFGDGGEIFRGFYYGKPSSYFSPQTDLSLINVIKTFRKKTKLDKCPWKFIELKEALETRLNSIIEQYSLFSTNGYDILDMLYLYERTMIWGTRRAAQTWKPHYRRPFESGNLAKLAYQMPAPIAKYARLQEKAIASFAPKIYGIRINGKTLLPLERGGSIANLLRQVDHRYQNLVKRFQPKIDGRGYNEIASETLANSLMDTVNDILCSEESLTKEIFNIEGIQRLMNEHKSQKYDHSKILVSLINMERWRILVQKVSKEAANKV